MLTNVNIFDVWQRSEYVFFKYLKPEIRYGDKFF